MYDRKDLLTDAARPTANLITVEIREDGTAAFALPRMEVGQGITTSTAMLIAEELDLPLDKVEVTLAPARPELVFNQLTGGSNTTVPAPAFTFTPQAPEANQSVRFDASTTQDEGAAFFLLRRRRTG